MDDVVVTILLLIFLFVCGCLYAFVNTINNRKKITELREELSQLREEFSRFKNRESSEESESVTKKADTLITAENCTREPHSAAESAGLQTETEVPGKPSKRSKYLSRKPSITVKKGTEAGESVLASIQNNWMVWLGGISVGLAGIFMVKYSIDQGLLSPLARVVISIITGVLLHLLAEYLRRKKGGHISLAALCGGASITLFAAFLAAHHLYNLFPALVVFTALALVSLATMFLAIIHGPVLAILGILAAYSLPLLVSTGSSNIAGALLYAAIITASGLILTRYVISSWLWKSIVVLTISWAFLGIAAPVDDPLSVTLYLAALGYMFMAIPHGDWLLSKGSVADCPKKHPIKRFLSFNDESDQLFYFFVSLLFLQVLNLIDTRFDEKWLYLLPFLPVFILLAVRKKDDFVSLAWLSFLGSIAPLLVHFISFEKPVSIVSPSLEQQNIMLILFGALVVVYSGFGLLNIGKSRFKGFSVSLAAAAPVVVLALIYTLLPTLRNETILIALCLATGALLFFLAYKLPLASIDKATLLSLLVSAHLAYGLAVVYVFNEATLTLALSTEFILLAVVRKVFDIPELDWLMKLMVGVVVARLTFNPFLLQYSPDVHWSLWTYGGSALCAAVACRLLPSGEKIRCWLEGAALHLTLLFVASELRYQLYDGNIFIEEYSSLEAAINTMLWSFAGLIYFKRAQLSESFMTHFYTVISSLLLILAVANHILFSLLHYNPLFGKQEVADTFFFNLLLLAYGLPIVPMVLALLMKVVKQRSTLAVFTGLSVFFFISIQIRHYFSPELYLGLGAGSAEIYTYSVVWLLIAVIAIIIGSRRGLRTIYQAGMIAILVVVAKIFFIDMAELEGLYRVASFMGLGISLLAIAFLHKWLQQGMVLEDDG